MYTSGVHTECHARPSLLQNKTIAIRACLPPHFARGTSFAARRENERPLLQTRRRLNEKLHTPSTSGASVRAHTPAAGKLLGQKKLEKFRAAVYPKLGAQYTYTRKKKKANTFRSNLHTPLNIPDTDMYDDEERVTQTTTREGGRRARLGERLYGGPHSFRFALLRAELQTLT